MLVGIIGKANTGKSTFFNAATLLNVPMAAYPFTTISPNLGVGYIRVKCVCKELNLDDNPVNSNCIHGNRFIPVKLVDVAGLVPKASEGKGLGNKFLDDLRQSDAVIHVVDSSGSTNSEGRTCEPGERDPLDDIEFVESEFDMWIRQIILRDWTRISKTSESGDGKVELMLAERLSGLSITEGQIHEAFRNADLKSGKPALLDKEDLLRFSRCLRRIAKPGLIAANKADLPSSESNIGRLREGDRFLVSCASEAELLLRRATAKGLIKYLPGDGSFEIIDRSKLTEEQNKALRFVEDKILARWGTTGVQEAINASYLSLLGGIIVYPVEDESKLSDKKGNVLPDAYVLKNGSTAKDLAHVIHTDIGDGFLYAMDAKKGTRVSGDYLLKDSDVICIASTSK